MPLIEGYVHFIEIHLVQEDMANSLRDGKACFLIFHAAAAVQCRSFEKWQDQTAVFHVFS